MEWLLNLLPFSKLPIRQVTVILTKSITPAISKLPIRQVTICSRICLHIVISKLPIRQVTSIKTTWRWL